jgi:hypothetical protein
MIPPQSAPTVGAVGPGEWLEVGGARSGNQPENIQLIQINDDFQGAAHFHKCPAKDGNVETVARLCAPQVRTRNRRRP